MQTNCIFVASNFVINPQILIISAFNIASFPPYWSQIHFSCHCSFACFTLRSICGTENSSQQTSQRCSSTINMVFSDVKILIKTHKYTQNAQLHAYRGIKIGVLEIQFVSIFSISAKYLQKIWIYNFPRLCSNMPNVRRVVLYGFCSKILKIG